MNVQAYLFFNGRTEEAIEFYQRAVGAKVEMLMRHKDMPEPGAQPAPGMANKVLHAAFRIGETQVLASDGEAEGAPPRFDGFSLAISAPTDADTQRLFSALSDGGVVRQPLIKTFFSSQFGMVADRFGVLWMVLTEGEAS